MISKKKEELEVRENATNKETTTSAFACGNQATEYRIAPNLNPGGSLKLNKDKDFNFIIIAPSSVILDSISMHGKFIINHPSYMINNTDLKSIHK